MATMIQRYKGWREGRLRAKLAKLAPPQQHAPSAATMDLAQRSGVKLSSLTWDDVEQRYTMLGPMTPVYSVGLQDSDLDRLLRASAWAWAAINGNARAMSQLTPIVQERVAGKWEKAGDEHPLYRFLADPLGTDDALPYWSWQHLYYVIALHYYSVGNAYLVPVDAMGDLSVVPLLRPHKMTADEDPRYGVPTVYHYDGSPHGGRVDFAPGSLVNVQAPNASSFWAGAAPLRAALRDVEIDHVATERQRYNLRNQIAPGPIVSFDYMAPSEAQREQIKQELIDNYREAQNHGDPLVLGSAAKVDKGWSPDELKIFDTRQAARDSILAVIGIQPSILGQLDRATYSNTKEATVLWWNASIYPLLSIVYGHLNAQLIQRRPGNEDSRLWFSLAGSSIGMQLLSSQLDVAEQLQKLGYSTNTINEHLELGLPEEDYLDKSTGADVIAGRVPADTADTTDTPAEEDEPAEVTPIQAAAE